MTYPIPNEQITSHHIFNLKNFDIRVISYLQDKNMVLKIDGDINGYLKYDHTLKNGALLYKYHVNDLKEGNYKIHIYDEEDDELVCDIRAEFTIGEEYTGKKEKYIQKVNFFLALQFIIIPFFIFLFIIVFPFFQKLNFNIVKNIERNIEDENYIIYTNKILLYLCLIFLSPFFLRLRVQSSKINPVLRYAIFIAFIYPLVLPIHFMQKIEGKVGYTFLVFVVLDGKVKYEHWAVQITLFYYAFTLFPFVLFESGKKFYNKNNLIYIIINSILCLALLIVSMIFNFLTVNQSLSFGYLFFSTAFVYIFIILLILFVIFFFK